MNPRERELLTGVGNCYEACHADFDSTIEMVAGTRRLSPEAVRETLASMKERFGSDPEYATLRRRLPEGFPL